MAKKPTSASNDPAALAFSAVEDALKDSVFNLDEGVDQRTPHPQLRDNRERTERLRANEKIASQTGSVANDDRFGATRILYGLQSKASPQPTYIAIGLSVVWVVAVILAEVVRLRSVDEGAPLFTNSLELVAFLAILVLPIAAFFAIATLVRRAQELRIAASSITQAAVRLAEPETTASEKVASVGQAVRREVNALGDGLERALSRAGELEVMIHNEVTALERTYSENESRMRALIQELASQRDSVITNTDRVREAITESHTGLVFDLDMISQRIAGTIVESGGNLTRALESAGNTLTNTFGERTDSFVQLVDNRTQELLSSLDESANRLNLTLEDRGANLSQAFEGRTYELSSVIDSRMNALVEAFDTRSSTLTEAIDTRTSSLAKLLAEGGATLLDQLRDRGHEVSGALDLTAARIANDLSQRSKDAEALFGSLAQQLDESVAVNINAMESRLHSAVIEIGGNLDEATERARSTLSSAGSHTLAQLDARVEEISGVIDGHLQGFEGIEGRLQGSLVDIGSNIDEAAERARRSLSQAGAQSLIEFDAKIDEIAGIIDARVQGLENIVGDKGERLVASLDKHTAAFAARANVLEMALDEKSGHFNEIVGQRTREMTESLGQRIKQVSDTIGGRTSELTDSLEGHANIIADALDNRLQLLNDTMRSRTDEFASALDNRTEFLNDALDQRTKTLSSTLDGRTQELSVAIEGRTRDLSEAVAARVQEINATLEGHSEVLNDTLDQRSRQLGSTLDSRTQQLAGAIATRSNELSEALGTRTQQLSDTLGAHTVDIANAINDRTVELARTIDVQGATLRDRIDGSLRNAGDVMADRADGLSSLIAGKVAEVTENLGRGVDSAILRMADAESGVTHTIESTASTVGESARRAADIIETGVNSARKAITDMVDQRLGTLPEAITARADITAERLAALNSAINTALVQSMADLESGADRLEETISQRIVAATANISSDVAATADRMDVAVRAALDQLQVAARTIEEIIEVKAVNAAEAVSGRVVEIHRAVDEQTSAFAALVNEKSEQLHIALLNHGNVLRDALGENAREAEALMAASNQRILTDVGSALYKLNESNELLQRVLDASTSNLANLETSIADQTASYSATVRDAIGSTEEAGRLVTEHVTALQNTISGMVAEFGTMVGTLDNEAKTIDQAATSLNTASSYAVSNLDERRTAMDALAQSFASRADDIDSRMRGFAQSIADTVNDTERRLIEARQVMEEALGATSTSVATVMSSATANLNDALSETTGQVTSVLDAAENRLASTLASTENKIAAALSGTEARFQNVFSDAEGRLGGVLSGTEGRLQDVMSNAEERLQRVASGTEERLNTVLSSTENRVGEALSNTADRVSTALELTTGNVTNVMNTTSGALADAINANTHTVVDALKATTADVAARLADIRGTATTEGSRADELLRQTQQAMIGEMQRALEDATRRFNETAAAMRSTAKEVNGELEATRAELARGVMELPEETRASAAAMRRVVAEQIEALSELNDIVRSQSATHDINERREPPRPAPQPMPRAEPVRQEAPRADPPHAPEFVARVEPAPAPRPEPARFEARPAPAPAPRYEEPVAPPAYQSPPQVPRPAYQPAARIEAQRVVESQQPAPQPQPAPPQAAQQPAAANGRAGDDNGGWLRDVLRNASAKQAGAQPQQSAGNLSGLTEEITRAIDLNALGDAWGRYQAGEANVFSRRIYTLTGQGTYDEVRKKLQRDPDFARTAQAYMGEFEQLLRRAAAGPRPAQESREYLLSDRGKVYTMLAHASGRLN
ncbi:MAG: hypothetical protein P4M09_09590 [Devosia sp.]|nr:hypothetical protein [Devosia sp.]